MAEEQKQLLKQIQDLIEQNDKESLKDLIDDQRTSDIAEVVELLDDEECRMILDVCDKQVSAEVFEKVDEATRSELFELLREEELEGLISELDAEDAADVLAELPIHESLEVLDHISSEHAAQIKDLMGYMEDSAGGIMDPDFISVQEDATVKEAINRIRSAEIDEDFFSVFVINKVGQFLGTVRIRSLITRPEETKVKDLIETDALYVQVDTDQEDVRNLFKKNDLIVVPVVDEEHHLVGRITADRVIEVAEEEAVEDIFTMAGTDAAELENFSPVHAGRVRMTWLLPCLAGTAVSAVLILLFEDLFNNAKILSIHTAAIAFLPMMMAISGNAGLQTSAIVICGLATGDLAALRIGQVFTREIKIALIVAICCAVIGAGISYVLPQVVKFSEAELPPAALLEIGMAFFISMFASIMAATTLGLFLPFLFRKIGIDPAIASGPLVTTANDCISVGIYLSLTFLFTLSA